MSSTKLSLPERRPPETLSQVFLSVDASAALVAYSRTKESQEQLLGEEEKQSKRNARDPQRGAPHSEEETGGNWPI